MISTVRKMVYILLLLLMSKTFYGQEHQIKHLLSVGLSVPMLSEGRGYHLAYNPSMNLYKYLDLQAHVSYCDTKISSAFLSGATGREKSYNILAGPRIYLRSESKVFRPYWFALVGMNRLVEERNGTMREAEYSFGLSTGIMAEISRIVVGVSAESPGTIVLRFGWLI